MTPADLAAACESAARYWARRGGRRWREVLGYAAIRALEMPPGSSDVRVRCAARFGARDGVRDLQCHALATSEVLTARPPNTEWEVGLREVLRRMRPLDALAALEAADGADGAETGAACRRSRITGWRVNARALAVARGAAGAVERVEGMQVEMWR